MRTRVVILSCGVAALAVLLVVWQLRSAPPRDSSEPARPSAPEAAAPAGLDPEQRAERMGELDRWEQELKEIAREKGEPWQVVEEKPKRPEGFDASAMAGSGLSAREIDRARERIEAAQREEARLRQEASAQGRGLSPVDREEVREQLEELRADLGDEDFDRLLYAAGEDNRIQVKKVMPRSPSARAGLIAGDIVLRYNGRPVFEPMDLHLLAGSVPRGEPVPIVFQRGGQIIEGSIDGGAVGLVLTGISVEP